MCGGLALPSGKPDGASRDPGARAAADAGRVLRSRCGRDLPRARDRRRSDPRRGRRGRPTGQRAAHLRDHHAAHPRDPRRRRVPDHARGDHAITHPVFAAFDRPAYVLQFDAHQDHSEIDEDLSRTNSHAFRHITAMDPCLGLTQVGIRGLGTTGAHVDELRAKGHQVVPTGGRRRWAPPGSRPCRPRARPSARPSTWTRSTRR